MRSSLVAIVILSLTTAAHAGGYYAGRDNDLRRANQDYARRIALANSNSPGWYTASYGVTYARATAGGRLGVVSNGQTAQPAPRPVFMTPNLANRPFPGQVRQDIGVWALTHATEGELAKAVGPKKAAILHQARMGGRLTTHAAIEAVPGIGKATIGRLMGLSWKYTDR